MSPEIMRPTSSTNCKACCACMSVTSPTCIATRISALTSEHSPRAIVYFAALSAYVNRPYPSAIFATMLTAARLSCDVRPNCSSRGKNDVSAYISRTRSIPRFHACKFVKDCSMGTSFPDLETSPTITMEHPLDFGIGITQFIVPYRWRTALFPEP